MIGIYKITNKINGKVYVGQSVELEERKREHFRCLRKGIHDNIYLQNSFYKYGEENFVFEVIEYISEPLENVLTEREQYWIDYYGGYTSSNTYNLKEAGSHGRDSELLKQIKSNAQKGKIMPKLSDEHKQAISEKLKGIKRSQETKNKISNARKGIKFSEEHCKHISEGKKGGTPWNKGVPASLETREKLSKAAKGQVRRTAEQYKEDSKKLWKPVAQYDKEGNLIKIWNSRKEILESGLFSKNIALHDCINGRIKTSGGYVWRNVGEAELSNVDSGSFRRVG